MPETIDLAAFVIDTARTALTHPYVFLTRGGTGRHHPPEGRCNTEDRWRNSTGFGIAQDGKVDG